VNATTVKRSLVQDGRFLLNKDEIGKHSILPTSKSTTTHRILNPMVATYEGCFEDIHIWFLPATFPHFAGHGYGTKELCTNYCMLRDYTYFGLKQQDVCYCVTQPPPTTPVSEIECNLDCRQDSNQKCGGWDANSVYKIENNEKYQGCFKEDSGSSTLPYYAGDSHANYESCSFICDTAGYQFFGLQDGYKCHCGNSISSLVQEPESKCDATCQENSNQICGGASANSVYSADFDSDNPSNNMKYMGCYEHDETNAEQVILPVLNTTENVTPKTCRDNCFGGGFFYFGLKDGSECYCGDLMPDTEKLNSECNTKCSADSTYTCGANLMTSVFEVLEFGMSMLEPPDNAADFGFGSGCSDVSGWSDNGGKSCSWYSRRNRCSYYGSRFRNDGLVANQACCACQ